MFRFLGVDSVRAASTSSRGRQGGKRGRPASSNQTLLVIYRHSGACQDIVMSVLCYSCQVLVATVLLLTVVEAAAWGGPSPAVGDADDALRRDIEEGLLLPPYPDSKHQQKLAPMPYVEASLFRTTSLNSTTSSGPVKKYRPGSSKLRLAPKKARKPFTTTKVAQQEEKTVEVEVANPPPPIWSHDVIADELSDPFGRLPSNEEYDRNTRFTHSILYGYNSGF